MSEKKPMFQASGDAEILAQHIQEMQKKGVTFSPISELNRVCGRNVQGDGRGVLRTARNTVLRDNSIKTGWKRMEGLEILTYSAAVRVLPGITKRIRRTARRGLQFSKAINDAAVTDKTVLQQLALHTSLHALMYDATSHSNMGKLALSVCPELKRLPLKESLAALAGNGNGKE